MNRREQIQTVVPHVQPSARANRHEPAASNPLSADGGGSPVAFGYDFTSSHHHISMKIAKGVPLSVAGLLALTYCLYTSARIRQLEARISSTPVEGTTTQTTYAFDNSFREYFGERGVSAVERSVALGNTDREQIMRELSLPKPGLPYRKD